MPIWLKLTGADMIPPLYLFIYAGKQAQEFRPPHIDADRNDDDRTDNDVLGRCGYGVEVQAVLNDHDRHGAYDGVYDIAAPASERRAADHGSGDGGKGCRGSCDGKCDELNSFDIDTGKAGSIRISAHRINGPSWRGIGQEPI